MKILSVVAAPLAAVSLLGSPAWASVLLDQNQPVDDPNVAMAAFGQTDLAQSFKQAQNNIAGAGIFLDPTFPGSGVVTISVWDKLPNQSGANMLAQGSASGAAGSWVDVFWSPITVAPATTLYLAFTDGGMAVGGSTSNPYANGQVYANAGYQSFPDFDYAFRTYYDTAGVVPEPSTVMAGVLMLLPLGVAGLSRLRGARR